MSLERDWLTKLIPRPHYKSKRAIWDAYIDALTSDECAHLFSRYGITNRKRLIHVLAQWAHESGGLTLIWESGAYSYNGIKRIFGVGRHSARITDSEARRIAALPVAKRTEVLFERAYGLGNPRKAKELGNAEPGDGWKYRGCGIVQITGKGDHVRYARDIGCAVDDLAKPINAIHAALLEWTRKNLNHFADRGDVRTITKRINGGYNGFADRKRWLAKADKIVPPNWSLAVSRPPAPPPQPEPVPPQLEQFEDREVVVQHSRKLWWNRWLGRAGAMIAAFFGTITEFFEHIVTTIAGLLTLSNISFARDWLAELRDAVSAWAIAIAAGIGLVIFVFARWFEDRAVEDAKEGRYEPSGLAKISRGDDA